MMQKDVGIKVFAPAKINLYLHITGRREDGYHCLDSVFLFTGLADELVMTPADEMRLVIDGPTSGALAGEAVDDNLVLRAVRLMGEAMGVSQKLDIRLTKNIPVAAGVGGGSADAAAAMQGCATLWQNKEQAHRLSSNRMIELAEHLGADVPPCLDGKPVRVEGIGEELSSVGAAPDWGILLAKPNVAMPTPAVFKAYKNSGLPFSAALEDGPFWTDVNWLKTVARNDLEATALALQPEIKMVIGALAALPGARLARMSGSGATCFALFDSPEEALAAHADFVKKHPRWWSWAGATFE